MSYPEKYKAYNRQQYALRAQLGLCRNCGKRKPLPGHVSCRICYKRIQARYVTSKEAILKSQKKYIDGLRDAAYRAYGGYICACCKETKREFLTIDHVNNDGAAHRREIGRGVFTLFLWMKRNNYPEGFRILCMNCNFSYGMYSYCPHKGKKESDGEICSR